MNGEKSRTKRKGKILKAVGMLRDVVIDPIQIFVCPDAERHIIKRMVSAMRNEFASFVGVPLLSIKEKTLKPVRPLVPENFRVRQSLRIKINPPVTGLTM